VPRLLSVGRKVRKKHIGPRSPILPASQGRECECSGTAYGGLDSNALSLTAGTFSTFSAAPFGNSQVGDGTADVPMTLSFRVVPWQGSCCTTVNIGNKFTDILDGTGILFTGTFTVPLSAIATGTFTAPVSLSGQLFAYQDLTLGQSFYTHGPLMASLLFEGTGTANLDLVDTGNGSFMVSFAFVTFNGTGNLTVVPEPSSLFLLGTGLAGFGTMLRRKILFRSST